MTLDLSTLKPGDVCITRGGYEIIYVGANPHVECENKYIFANKYGTLSYSPSCFYIDGVQSAEDIISLKPKVIERWVNVYRQDGTIYLSSTFIIERNAIQAGKKVENFEYIKTIRITDEKE